MSRSYAQMNNELDDMFSSGSSTPPSPQASTRAIVPSSMKSIRRNTDKTGGDVEQGMVNKFGKFTANPEALMDTFRMQISLMDARIDQLADTMDVHFEKTYPRTLSLGQKGARLVVNTADIALIVTYFFVIALFVSIGLDKSFSMPDIDMIADPSKIAASTPEERDQKLRDIKTRARENVSEVYRSVYLQFVTTALVSYLLRNFVQYIPNPFNTQYFRKTLNYESSKIPELAGGALLTTFLITFQSSFKNKIAFLINNMSRSDLAYHISIVIALSIIFIMLIVVLDKVPTSQMNPMVLANWTQPNSVVAKVAVVVISLVVFLAVSFS